MDSHSDSETGRFRHFLELLPLILVLITGLTFGGNRLAVGVATALPGEAVTIPVTLDSDADIVGLQLDVLYDSSILEVDTPLEGEAPVDHVFTHSFPSPGVLRLLVYLPSRNALRNGTFLNLPITVDAAATAGASPLVVTGVVLGRADALGVPADELMFGAVLIGQSPVPVCAGDLNDDRTRDVLDLVEMLNRLSAGLDEPAGDLDGNGSLDVIDLVRLLRHIDGLEPLSECINALPPTLRKLPMPASRAK